MRHLLTWGEGLLGPNVLEGVEREKWQFLSLPLDRKFWALLANPTRYRIEDAVRELQVDHWLIGKADVRRGDRVAIWKAKGSDRNRGIVALGEVLTDPELCLSAPAEERYWLDPDGGKEGRRVIVRYVNPARHRCG